MGISSRLPSRQQSIQVFGIIVLMVYSWTILWFLWRLPTWLIFLTAWEILGVLSFSLVTALIDSLVILCLLMILAVCLPKGWLLESFVGRGGALAATAIAYMMFVDMNFKHEMLFPELPVKAWLLALPILTVALIPYATGRIPLLRKAVEAFADRATIFVYLMLPLSGLSIVVLVVRLLIPVLRA